MIIAATPDCSSLFFIDNLEYISPTNDTDGGIVLIDNGDTGDVMAVENSDSIVDSGLRRQCDRFSG